LSRPHQGRVSRPDVAPSAVQIESYSKGQEVVARQEQLDSVLA